MKVHKVDFTSFRCTPVATDIVCRVHVSLSVNLFLTLFRSLRSLTRYTYTVPFEIRLPCRPRFQVDHVSRRRARGGVSETRSVWLSRHKKFTWSDLARKLSIRYGPHKLFVSTQPHRLRLARSPSHTPLLPSLHYLPRPETPNTSPETEKETHSTLGTSQDSPPPYIRLNIILY